MELKVAVGPVRFPKLKPTTVETEPLVDIEDNPPLPRKLDQDGCTGNALYLRPGFRDEYDRLLRRA